MTCWALLAVKPPHLGKTRLAGVLSRAQRERLIRVMLARVLDALGLSESFEAIHDMLLNRSSVCVARR